MAQIIDVFTYNGEADLLEIRLNVLNDYVDQFIIVEAPTTFSGQPKPLYYEQQKDRFEKWSNKIKYYINDSNYSKEEIDLAMNSPSTQFGKSHWVNEFLQKESLKKAMTHLQDEDVVILGDVDEIWDKSALAIDKPQKLKLKVYTYWLNNRSSEEFYGPVIANYGTIKSLCFNDVRNYCTKTNEEYGLHFTSMGGYESVKKKLTDGYTKDTYANDAVMGSLNSNIANNKDFLGRDFTYMTDESEWPQYLKDNRDKYNHLLR